MDLNFFQRVAYEQQVANVQRFADACAKAHAQSVKNDCTVHVSARLGIPTGMDGVPTAPVVIGYTLSDWYDDSVVRSYTNGRSSN